MCRVIGPLKRVDFVQAGRIGEMNGCNPESKIKVVAADAMYRAQKAKVKQAICESVLQPPGAQAPACLLKHFYKLERSWSEPT